MQCLCVDPKEAHRVWPLISHLIVAAMNKGSNGAEDATEVHRAVLAGEQLLWVAADDRGIWAAAVTQLSNGADERKLCTIMAAGGHEREQWLHLKTALEDFARTEGCAVIRIYGRRGWARELPDYKLTRVMLEKRLD